MRRALPIARGCLILCLTSLGWAPPAAAQGLDARMQSVVAKFVEKTGEHVMTVGSWIRGGFNVTTSDFDMRLVVPDFKTATRAQQLARWQNSKRVLTSLIREEFGTVPASNILSRTNLYAPTDLMVGIEDASDATERFRQLKTVPSLGHTGPVNANTPVKFTEGLYGAGARSYVQGYEKTAGRLYYLKDGKCLTGLSEMAGMSEGVGEAAYTAAGTANTAGQWAEHALDELAASRGEKVAKYLERLERDLAKSRSLNSLPVTSELRTEMRQLRALLKKSPGKVGELGERLTKVLTRGRTEAAILRSMSDAGPIRRMFGRIMLDGVAAGNKVGELMGKVMERVATWDNAERAMKCVFMIVGAKATGSALGEGDALDALAAGSAEFKWVAAFGPVLIGQLCAEILIQAKNNGYLMAAGSQNAWNLMLGYYTAWGRVGVDPDPRRKLTLADMVARFQDEGRLQDVVLVHALRASTRDLGKATAAADQGVANAIFAQCWPVIREGWRWERDCLATEYLQLASKVVHTPLALSYKPNPTKPGEPVVVEAASFDRKLGERLERMRQIIRILYGKGSTVASNYYWSAGGSDVGDRDWQRSYTFAEPGTYPVTVTLDIQPFTTFAKTEPRVMLRRVVPALVDVKVEGPPKPVANAQIEFRIVLGADSGAPGSGGTSAGTDVLKGPVTVNGSRFEATVVEHVPSTDPAVSDLTTRWRLHGTLSADRTVCTELVVDYEEVRKSANRIMTLKFAATVRNMPMKPNTTGQWYARPPTVEGVTTSRTYSDLGASSPMAFNGTGFAELLIYGQGLWTEAPAGGERP